MAPTPDSAYFPSLDKFFEGDQLLISWKTACYTLLRCYEFSITEPSALGSFFSDPAVLELLAHPSKAFSAPNPQTKSAFETKTSAINVTPSSITRYDIKEVKEDALWLSKEAKIDEVSALRVVIVECQDRPSAQLLVRFSNEEAASIQEAAGASKAPTALLSRNASSDDERDDFHSQESRRLRILRTYLSERRNVLQCLNLIAQAFLSPRPEASRSGKGKGTAKPISWIQALGEKVWPKIVDHEAEWIVECLGTIRINVGNMETGSRWLQADGGREDIEMEWMHNQIIEISHTMEIIYQIVYDNSGLASSTVIIAWLEAMERYGFFNQLPTEDPMVEPLFLSVKILATLTSLSLLGPATCIDFLRVIDIDPRISLDASQDLPYIFNLRTLTRIHTTLMRVSDEMPMNAAPIVLAWADILQAMSIRVAERASASDEETHQASSGDIFEATLQKMLQGTPDETVDVIQYLASSAVDRGRVFLILTDLGLQLGGTSNSYFSATVGAKMRIAILDLMQSSSAVGYIPELVEAALSALTGGQTYWDLLDAEPSRTNCDVLAHFLTQPGLLELLSSAKNRFPYESALLKMIRPLSSSYDMVGPSLESLTLREIETIHTFTCQLPDDFSDYTTTQEEENNNSIRLTTTLHMFEEGVKVRGIQLSASALMKVDDDFTIPSDTNGRMILDSPKVAYWSHQYSSLKYFGKLLETFLAAGDVIDAITGEAADRDSVADIIGMLAGLLMGNHKATEADPSSTTDLKNEARLYLEVASSGLSQNRDIVAVIFDIFQEELQRQSTNFGADVSLEVLVSCVEFTHAVLPFYPGRVWPLMRRSGLLELGRGGGRLSTIVGSAEVVSGRFDLLLACTCLFEGLVEDFVSRAVERRNGGKSVARFGNDEALDMGTGVFGQTLSKVLLSFTRYFVDVLESSCTWKFVVQDDRRRLSKNVTNTFDRILRCACGIDSQPKSSDDKESKSKDGALVKMILGPQAKQNADKQLESRIMEPLLPAASHLVSSFLSTSSGTLRFRPLLETLHDGFSCPPSTTFINGMALRVDQVNATLTLSTTLLRVGVLLGKPHSQLESQLFRASPLIARLYAVDESYRLPVVSLFEALIVSASNDSVEPPSLLGFLGTQTSKNFLHVLSDLDKPLRRHAYSTAIWQFLAVIVSNRQQWFANYLLTGQGSKNPLKPKGGKGDLAKLDRPLLDTALDALSRISTLYKPEALAMLDFVALAQNFWPWATYGAAKHAAFIKAISEYVGILKPIQPSPQLDESIDACYQTRITAYIAEILAMHLFHSRQMGNKVPAKDLLSNMSYYLRFAVALPGYNSSLHGNLKRNFESRFPGCSILDFERTALEQRPLGRGYFYNYPILNQTLKYDRNWQRADGLRIEVVTANVNLSLVDAQIALLHGWSFLAIELSNDLSNQPDLQKVFAKMSSDCLISNQRSQGLEEIFQRLNQRRAELALILIQRLIEVNTNKRELEELLRNVWDTIQHSETSFDLALLAGNVEYYRTLLKLLFLALRVHADTGDQEEANRRSANGRDPSKRMIGPSCIVPIVLAILETVVAHGTSHLTTFIHDKLTESNPEDVALLTGILQACLRIPGIEFYYPQIVSMFTANDTARVAVSLFSWSDSLAIEGDPVYGELSILFLLELSTIPPMAEQLAIEGVLGQIGGTNIIGFLRRTVINPSTDSAGVQRCYSTWVRGILPLLLNILVAVGDAIGTEVALFVNQFPNLLKQSSEAFDTPETSRIVAKGTFKRITLSMCSEIHSLSLILYILHGFRQSDAGAAIPDVKWDISNVLEGVEYWLGSKVLLKERILPLGEQAAWTKKIDGTSKLDAKVVFELEQIRNVLTELTGGT